MNFTPLSISGAYQIELLSIEDERGFFARHFCQKAFQEKGIDFIPTQSNISFNKTRGTLRGMHFQISPNEEAKLIWCASGSLFDAFIDLRPSSPTFLKWGSLLLDSRNPTLLFLPKGMAHGFQTLQNDTQIFYLMGASYHPASARGIRWNDPLFSITWPIENPILSPKDQAYPDFRP